jgi:hypothetical protein
MQPRELGFLQRHLDPETRQEGDAGPEPVVARVVERRLGFLDGRCRAIGIETRRSCQAGRHTGRRTYSPEDCWRRSTGRQLRGGAAHWPQNFMPEGFSAWHRGHFTSTPPTPDGSRCGLGLWESARSAEPRIREPAEAYAETLTTRRPARADVLKYYGCFPGKLSITCWASDATHGSQR